MDKIFFNNQIIARSDCLIDPSDRGLLLADGLFETMHAYNGKIPFLSDHWQRLRQGAKILAFKLPLTLPRLKNITATLLQKNNMQNQQAILRLTITRGPGERGLLPPPVIKSTVILTVAAYIRPKKALTTHIVSIKRNEFSPLANIKTLNYLENILAKQKAQHYGADDAIMLNTKEHLAEASAANIFIITENKILTPRLQDGALAGVIRKQIFVLAATLSIPCCETPITTKQLLQAHEIFLTNSVLEIVPVIKVDQHIIGGGKIGPITQQLQQAFRQLITQKIQNHAN